MKPNPTAGLRPELAELVEDLLRGTDEGEAITLDAVGEAIGIRAVTTHDIEAILATIQRRGRNVVSAEGGHGEATLKSVLAAARMLRVELGRAPRPDEIATRSGLSPEAVKHALALARIMQR